ncbi:MAG: glutamate racemase [Polaromonas sp.]|nr:glutamate racemase [Polaromonas sp.]
MSRGIGVFDSGVGGLSFLRALRAEMPHEHFIYVADSGHAPYGERSQAAVLGRSRAIVRHLADQHVKALVIACNTATAASIHLLRGEHPALALIGVEPGLKPAASLSQTGRVGVMATRGTLDSARFAALLAAQDEKTRFILQPCDGLADAIEHSAASGDESKTIALCAYYVSAMGTFGKKPGQIDTLVLGCTHYPFASPHLRALLGPQVQLVDNGEAVARQTRRRLLQEGAGAPGLAQSTEAGCIGKADEAGAGQVSLFTTGQPQALQAAAQRWLNLPASVIQLSF